MTTVYVEKLAVPLFKLLVCVGAIFLIGAIINIIIDKIKGRSNQKILKKRDISNSDIEILVESLGKIKGHNKIFVHNKYIIFITEYRIVALLVCDYYGILSGEEDEPNWNLKSGNVSEMIKNPTLNFDAFLQMVRTKIGNHDIETYILLGGNTILNMNLKNIEVLRRNNVHYAMSTRTNGQKYTPQEVEDIYAKLIM